MSNLRALERLGSLDLNLSLRRRAFLAACAAAALAACDRAAPPASSTPSTSAGIAYVGSPSPTARPNRPSNPEYYEHSRVVATVFWFGEDPNNENFNISNADSAWVTNVVKQFGGIDDPDKRNPDGSPAGFTPRFNRFYVALPADDFDANGNRIPGSWEASPWASEIAGFPSDGSRSLFKGRWVGITRTLDDGSTREVYAQWGDTGPSDNPDEATDYRYVFGGNDERPANQAGLGAGIDLSPSVALALGMTQVREASTVVSWRFVDPQNVPEGPWKQEPPIDDRTYWA